MMNKILNRQEQKAWEEYMSLCKRIADTDGPDHSETEEAKQKRIKYLLKPGNFFKFVNYYFPKFADSDPAWFHEKAIKDFLDEELRNHIWEWSRESAKSVLGDVFLPAYLLCTGWLEGLILASETSDKACKLIGDLQAQLMYNTRLINDFGDFGITGSWMQGYFQTRDGVGFWAFGIGQNPAGVRNGYRRPNMGIVDDADSKKKYKNQERVKEDLDWIKGDFAGCLQTKKRKFLYSNNRVHKYGLTAHMVGDLEEGDPKNPGYNHIKVYWTEDPKTHKMRLIEDGGVPSWPRYTVKQAQDKIDDMGYRNAMRQLYHMHIEDGNIFTDDNMPWVKPLPLDRYDAHVIYCDPAFGESGKGCYRAVIHIAKIGLDYHILKVWLKQTGDFAKAQHEMYTSTLRRDVSIACWVESNELQKAHLKRIYKDLNRSLKAPWYPNFDMEKKADKIGRIESLESIADHYHMLFSEAERKNPSMQTLRDQFKAFPNGFVDGPDCVEGGMNKLVKRAVAINFKPRTGKYYRSSKRRL